MKFFHICIALFMLSFTSVQVVAQKAQLPLNESYRIGETWEWSEKRISDSAPEKALMEGVDTQVVIMEAGRKKFLKRFTGGSKTFEIDQESHKTQEKPFRKWPLKVGAKWEYEENWTSNDGTTGYTKQDVEVVGIEKIKVPSGTYSAYKIVHLGMFKNAHGEGKMNDTFWYVPEVKADVKHVNESGGQTYTSVLVKYIKGSK